jgi:hypothetical protein
MKKNACVAKQASRWFDLGAAHPTLIADFGTEKKGRVEPIPNRSILPLQLRIFPMEQQLGLCPLP